MTSPRRVPIFDGHNDVLFRLFRCGGSDAPRAFLEGEGKQRVVRSVWLIGPPISRISAPLDFVPNKCFQADAL